MKALKCFLILLGTIPALKSYSQILTDSHYSIVVLDEGARGIIGVDSIHIDTLVLNDDSSLKFYQSTKLVVERAFIGKRCEINSAGSDGLNGIQPGQLNGEHGKDGKDLILVVNFNELGSLIINTSGGNAAHGRNGGEGQDGGDGGNGGKAGNLTLIYAHEGFVPIFNSQGHKHTIQLQYVGGKPGIGGRGGRGSKGMKAPTRTEYAPQTGQKKVIVEGPPVQGGSSGKSGTPGKPGQDGELILKRKD